MKWNEFELISTITRPKILISKTIVIISYYMNYLPVAHPI